MHLRYTDAKEIYTRKETYQNKMFHYLRVFLHQIPENIRIKFNNFDFRAESPRIARRNAQGDLENWN